MPPHDHGTPPPPADKHSHSRAFHKGFRSGFVLGVVAGVLVTLGVMLVAKCPPDPVPAAAPHGVVKAVAP